MSQSMPSFWGSPYFVPEPDNWHLTDDAPEEMKKEFAEYMTLEDALKKAQDQAAKSGLSIGGDILDDGEYFIFGYTEDADVSPVGVNKDSGNVIDYFPPDHADKFLNAMKAAPYIK